MKRILSLAVLVAFVASAPAHAEGKGPTIVNMPDLDPNVVFPGPVQYVKPHEDVALVPEPETYAMVVAGLAAVVFLVRRRSQR